MQLYKISFPPHLSTKVYIGISSKSAAHRFKTHCSSKKDYPISQALRKYGRENAILEVLGDFDNHDVLYAAEQKAIREFGSKAPNGYNLTDGGKGTYGHAATEERKRKISEANKGCKPSTEARHKISESNKQRDLSLQVEAMRLENKGKKLAPEQVQRMREVWIGRKHTEESKRKMSESASKRKASPETRAKMSKSIKAARGGKVFAFLSPCGEKVSVSNMKEFCASNLLTPGHMYNVASGSEVAHKGWKKCTE